LAQNEPLAITKAKRPSLNLARFPSQADSVVSLPSPLLILGASVRAAACSAERAGFQPLACDLFADADLSARCPTLRAVGYPHGLAAGAACLPSAPWMYTGGLENHPDVVDQIAATRELLGNAGPVLRAVRDPFQLAAAFSRAGLAFPPVLPAYAAAPDSSPSLRRSSSLRPHPAEARPGRGLLKRRTSSGGTGVRRWEGCLPSQATPDDWYLQQWVAGRPCSAVYVAAAGTATLLGISAQLIAVPWCGGQGFRYCGSLGPLRLSPATVARFRRIGDCLAASFALRGLFGVDAILTPREVWPVDVNPRYTASIEVLERALGVLAVQRHVAACRQEAGGHELRGASGIEQPSAERSLDAKSLAAERHIGWCGKVILYAPRPEEARGAATHQEDALDGPAVEIATDAAGELLAAATGLWPDVADVPSAGTRIEPGHPICTLFAAAPTQREVLARLQAAAAHWSARLAPTRD